MTFNFGNESFGIDVENVFSNVAPDDYIDTLDALGIVLHCFDNEKMSGCNVMLFLSEDNKNITIEIEDTIKDEYHIIHEFDISEDEKRIILNNL